MTSGVYPRESRQDRFRRLTAPPDDQGCELWLGGISPTTGYGNFWYGGNTHSAHRYAWEQANGPVPLGLQMRHKCRNRHCVSLSHLETGTASENARDKWRDGTAQNGRGVIRHSLPDGSLAVITALRGFGIPVTRIAVCFGVGNDTIRNAMKRGWDTRPCHKPRRVSSPT